MPLYEYKCGSCGDVFEVKQKFSDEPLSVHTPCGGTVTRLISAPALQFKGSGWYITDYAKSNGNGGSKAAENGKSESSEGKNGSSSSGASAPAATTSSSASESAVSKKAS
jgi:putative FmdB family regulatory protein